MLQYQKMLSIHCQLSSQNFFTVMKMKTAASIVAPNGFRVLFYLLPQQSQQYFPSNYSQDPPYSFETDQQKESYQSINWMVVQKWYQNL